MGCLIDETTVQKIVHLTENIAVVYSGMGPDFRVLCRKGRKAAQAYYRVYQEIIPVSMLVRELAAVMQELTLKEGFEGAMDHQNIEVGIIGADKKFKVLSPA